MPSGISVEDAKYLKDNWPKENGWNAALPEVRQRVTDMVKAQKRCGGMEGANRYHGAADDCLRVGCRDVGEHCLVYPLSAAAGYCG